MKLTAAALMVLGTVGVTGCGMGEDPFEADITDTASLPLSGCPVVTEGMDPEAVAATETLNSLRKLSGLGCVELSPPASVAAKKHCEYYVANKGTCIARPHREVDSCNNYMAETFSDRLRKVEYEGAPRFEVMAYVGNGPTSVQQWLDSIWHRIPILSPDVDQAGYGRHGRCDTMDFGYSNPVPPAPRNLVFPREDQTQVPRSFSGRESPPPPPPPSGWPSGYPITLYAAELKEITEHSIMVDGTNVPIEHTWLAPGDARSLDLLIDEFMMYTHKPLAPNTKYRVRIAGTQRGEKVAFDWTFTTR